MRVVKLLLDENLSPFIAVQLRDAGEDVVHVRDRGALGSEDPDVMSLALDEDRIVVTKNWKHFRNLALRQNLHGGLVLIRSGGLDFQGQRGAIDSAIAAIRAEYEAGRELINRAVWVDGDDVRVEPLFLTEPH